MYSVAHRSHHIKHTYVAATYHAVHDAALHWDQMFPSCSMSRTTNHTQPTQSPLSRSRNPRIVCRGLVEEKESGARDLMCIQGLQPWVLPSAWAITYALILTVVSVVVTVVCCASFLRNTQPSLLLVRFSEHRPAPHSTQGRHPHRHRRQASRSSFECDVCPDTHPGNRCRLMLYVSLSFPFHSLSKSIAAGAVVGILGGGAVLRHAGGLRVLARQDRCHRRPAGALLPTVAPLHLLPHGYGLTRVCAQAFPGTCMGVNVRGKSSRCNSNAAAWVSAVALADCLMFRT